MTILNEKVKKNVLLYYPPATDDMDNPWLNFPLPMLSVCSLVDRDSYELCIENGLYDSWERLLRQSDNAVCLGISIKTGSQIKHALSLARQIRAKRLDLPIVLGGYHASALPDQTLENPFVDIVVRGYGEVVFLNLVNSFSEGGDFRKINGISYREGERIVHNKDEAIPRLDDLPPVPYHLVDTRRYIEADPLHSIAYSSSRGCPHRCGFCSDSVVYKHIWNPLSSERVISDLQYLNATYKPEVIRLVDPNFFVDEARVARICEGLIQKNIGLRLVNVNGDAHILTRYSDDTIALMRKAGIENILIGVESGYLKALDCISKKSSKEETVTVLSRLRRHGISVGHSMIMGYPFDIPSSQMEDEHRREFIATMTMVYDLSLSKIPGDYYLLFRFTAFPGVRLFDRYLKLGLHQPATLEEWSTVNMNEFVAPWISDKVLGWISNCQIMSYYFSATSKELWNKKHIWVIKVLPQEKFDKMLSNVINRINTRLYRNILNGDFRLPLLLKIWYHFERLCRFLLMNHKRYGFAGAVNKMYREAMRLIS
ncbi:MAG: B12-binding domain-containing radical SAM protein [Geobacter sp.]|nr:B12-binding domain-containing radical SAM protein [Geobacter sp.]